MPICYDAKTWISVLLSGLLDAVLLLLKFPGSAVKETFLSTHVTRSAWSSFDIRPSFHTYARDVSFQNIWAQQNCSKDAATLYRPPRPARCRFIIVQRLDYREQWWLSWRWTLLFFIVNVQFLLNIVKFHSLQFSSPASYVQIYTSTTYRAPTVHNHINARTFRRATTKQGSNFNIHFDNQAKTGNLKNQTRPVKEMF